MAKLDLTIPDLQLPDGHKIPMLAYGLGTAWFKNAPGSLDQKLIETTQTAIKMGYHHIDGAEMYNTELEQGKAIKECGLPRDQLFVTTKCLKVTSNVAEHLDASLKKLGLDYVDLYLLHFPTEANGDATILQNAWRQMEDLQAAGKAKSIGVSNFLREHLEPVLETCRVRPAINQIQYHPYLQHGDLVAFHKNKDIRLAAYSPLVPVTKAVDGPLTGILEGLAKKYAVNPGEICLRWVIDQNVVAVTTSSNEQRLSDMLRVVTFKLTPKEVDEISEIGRQYHFDAW